MAPPATEVPWQAYYVQGENALAASVSELRRDRRDGVGSQSRICSLARRTGRFPQLADPGSGVKAAVVRGRLIVSHETLAPRKCEAKGDRCSLRSKGESTHRNSAADVDRHQILTEFHRASVGLAHQAKCGR